MSYTLEQARSYKLTCLVGLPCSVALGLLYLCPIAVIIALFPAWDLYLIGGIVGLGGLIFLGLAAIMGFEIYATSKNIRRLLTQESTTPSLG